MAEGYTAATGSEETEQQVTFTVKSSSESKYALTIPTTATVTDLKQKLSTDEYASLPPERQRLIYSGRVLKDADTIGSCKIKDGNTVHLVKGAESNTRQNPANQGGSTATSVPPGAGQTPASNVPSNIAAGTGAGNPLAQLTGARYAGFHGLPGMENFGADGGMGAPPNPDQMLRMLDDPNFAQQMNEAMNNPAVIEMLRNNPMIRDNPMARQAIENPELRRMMMNPDMIRMQMQMQRAMGGQGGGGPGGAGEGGFPMPGQTDTTPGSGEDGTAAARDGDGNAGANQTGGAAANPFAALFPGAGGGAGATGGQQGGNQNNPLANMTQQLMQNPEMMQSMMRMMGGGGMGGGGSDTNNPSDGGGANNPFGGAGGFNPFMFGGAGAAAGGFGEQPQAPQSPPDNRPPEERYEDQLRQLNDMGFYEFERNVQALRRSGGSVQGAVEYLLNAS